jgi:Uma2 family endonuclease
MSAQPQPRLTPEQYLEIERAAQFRSEYYGGRMYAMSGGTYFHALIIANLSGEIRNALKGRPCMVTSSDLRVQVERGGLYTYPDVVVACGERRFLDKYRDILLNPTLLVEVLSPSSESYDRGFKAAQYRTVDSLQEYALVSQAEPRVEVFRRQDGGTWLFSEAVGLESAARFESLGCTVALSEIYANVTFGGEENPERPGPAS